MSKIRSLMAKKQEAIKTASSRKEKKEARQEFKAGVAAVKEKRAARKATKKEAAATSSKPKKSTATTTRAGKTITNKKVIAKRKSNRGEITNRVRARKLAGKKTRTGAERKAAKVVKLSPVEKPGKVIDSKRKKPTTTRTKAGKTVTNKKVVAKRKANQGGVTNRLRARKMAGKKTKARG